MYFLSIEELKAFFVFSIEPSKPGTERILDLFKLVTFKLPNGVAKGSCGPRTWTVRLLECRSNNDQLSSRLTNKRHFSTKIEKVVVSVFVVDEEGVCGRLRVPERSMVGHWELALKNSTYLTASWVKSNLGSRSILDNQSLRIVDEVKVLDVGGWEFEIGSLREF